MIVVYLIGVFLAFLVIKDFLSFHKKDLTKDIFGWVILICLCMITGVPNADTVLNCCVRFPKGIRLSVRNAAASSSGFIRASVLSARRRADAAETAPDAPDATNPRLRGATQRKGPALPDMRI